MPVGNSNAHTGLFFRRVGYTGYDVTWLLEHIDFANRLAFRRTVNRSSQTVREKEKEREIPEHQIARLNQLM
jgi:hypothetical protein